MKGTEVISLFLLSAYASQFPREKAGCSQPWTSERERAAAAGLHSNSFVKCFVVEYTACSDLIPYQLNQELSFYIDPIHETDFYHPRYFYRFCNRVSPFCKKPRNLSATQRDYYNQDYFASMEISSICINGRPAMVAQAAPVANAKMTISRSIVPFQSMLLGSPHFEEQIDTSLS